jgi:hypothetical protein
MIKKTLFLIFLTALAITQIGCGKDSNTSTNTKTNVLIDSSTSSDIKLEYCYDWRDEEIDYWLEEKGYYFVWETIVDAEGKEVDKEIIDSHREKILNDCLDNFEK